MHPVHLSHGGASAFIPFCAYKSDLTVSDHLQRIQGISYPVCSSFHQTILEGQICYELKLNRSSGQGKDNELMLLLDYNEDRSIQPARPVKELPMNSTRLRLRTLGSLEDREAKVHINLLSSYLGFGGGSYKMTVVKRMTPTGDFLQMSAKDRNCDVEAYENCRTRKLLKKCKSLVDGGNCSSEIYQDCLETYATEIFNCSVACKGIYADVEWSDEKVIGEKAKNENGEELDRAKLLKLIEEYQEHKKQYVRNFKFTANPDSSAFGNSLFYTGCFLTRPP